MKTATTNPTTFTLTIDGMTCGHCVQTVTKALASVPGVAVRSVAVGSAQITAPDGLTVAKVVEVLGEAGYTARASELTPGTATDAGPGASCCGGAKKNAARGGCCG